MHTQIEKGIVLFQEDIPMAIQVVFAKQKNGSMESITRTACSYSCNRFNDALFFFFGVPSPSKCGKLNLFYNFSFLSFMFYGSNIWLMLTQHIIMIW